MLNWLFKIPYVFLVRIFKDDDRQKRFLMDINIGASVKFLKCAVHTADLSAEQKD